MALDNCAVPVDDNGGAIPIPIPEDVDKEVDDQGDVQEGDVHTQVPLDEEGAVHVIVPVERPLGLGISILMSSWSMLFMAFR